MAFCASCGAEVNGPYCGKCGAPTGQAAPGGQPSYSSQPQYQGQPQSAGLDTNVASTLTYVLGFITGIIFLLIAPYNQNRTVRFHAFQSIFLHVGVIAFWIVMGIVGAVLGDFLGLGMLALYPLISLAIFGLWLFLLIKTYQGSKIVLPVIGPLAEQQANK